MKKIFILLSLLTVFTQVNWAQTTQSFYLNDNHSIQTIDVADTVDVVSIFANFTENNGNYITLTAPQGSFLTPYGQVANGQVELYWNQGESYICDGGDFGFIPSLRGRRRGCLRTIRLPQRRTAHHRRR